MNRIILVGIFLVFSIGPIISQNSIRDNYDKAFEQLENLIVKSDTTIKLKNAVFIVENAYFDNKLSYEKYDYDIKALSYLAKRFCESNMLKYDETDKEAIAKHAAIFKVMTDTIPLLFDTSEVVNHIPFTYDFNDIWGEREWSNMFVIKLLASKKGNCHSLPLLYKILTEELDITSHLALAPNHFYIKTKSEKFGWYNTELTSGMFPIDAWIMASGYIHLNAIQNRMYMQALDKKQTIAICLTDLAEGYARKTNFQDPDFVQMCCNLALSHFPNYINANLLKIKVFKKQFEDELAKENPNKIFTDWIFSEIELLTTDLYKKGYRQMPKKMYLEWLVSLKTEREKYTNKKISN